jgi:hypothetical protein
MHRASESSGAGREISAAEVGALTHLEQLGRLNEEVRSLANWSEARVSPEVLFLLGAS